MLQGRIVLVRRTTDGCLFTLSTFRSGEANDTIMGQTANVLVTLTEEIDELSALHFTTILLPLVEEENSEEKSSDSPAKNLSLAVLR